MLSTTPKKKKKSLLSLDLAKDVALGKFRLDRRLWTSQKHVKLKLITIFMTLIFDGSDQLDMTQYIFTLNKEKKNFFKNRLKFFIYKLKRNVQLYIVC